MVILYPVSQQFGLAGLLIATLMSGLLLIIMGLARLGRLIEFISLPVTLGFTSGIAITIGTMQIKDFFGLHIATLPEHYLGKVAGLLSALPTFTFADTLVGIVTLSVLIYWPRLGIRLPPHLPALLAGVAVMGVLWGLGMPAATISSRLAICSRTAPTAKGSRLSCPTGCCPGNCRAPVALTANTLSALLPAAFSMAMLGAIESLLCAVVLDGMTGKKHQSDNELIGQGIGNVLAPFFGGITATAAIAHSAANVRAGATSPVSALVHALLVLLALLVLASLLFMRRMTRLTELPCNLPMTRVVRINGPLFFATAERIFAELSALTPEDKYLILQWDAVPVLDAGGLQAFMQFCNKLPAGQHVLVTDIPFQPLKTLARANVMPIADRLSFCSTLPQALEYLSTPPATDALAVGQGR